MLMMNDRRRRLGRYRGGLRERWQFVAALAFSFVTSKGCLGPCKKPKCWLIDKRRDTNSAFRFLGLVGYSTALMIWVVEIAVWLVLVCCCGCINVSCFSFLEAFIWSIAELLMHLIILFAQKIPPWIGHRFMYCVCRWIVVQQFASAINVLGKASFEPDCGGDYHIFLRRPLNPVILVYAAHDVRHMIPLYRLLVSNQPRLSCSKTVRNHIAAPLDCHDARS